LLTRQKAAVQSWLRGIPDITVEPTPAQILAGDDPVLTAALNPSL
jgi:hypothetical protein